MMILFTKITKMILSSINLMFAYSKYLYSIAWNKFT